MNNAPSMRCLLAAEALQFWEYELGMSISSVNGDPRGDCSVLRSEVGEFFSVGIGMQKKIPPKEV
jgi:hypothetical protein